MNLIKRLKPLAICIITILPQLLTSQTTLTNSRLEDFEQSAISPKATTVLYNSKVLGANRQIKGYFLSHDGTPISGVIIKANSSSTMSNTDGSFILTCPNNEKKLQFFLSNIEILTGEVIDGPGLHTFTQKNNNPSLATKLTGLFTSQFGERTSTSPNVALSETWKVNDNFILNARFSALQNNRDTSRYTNGINIFNTDISNWNLDIGGTYEFVGKTNRFGVNFALNLYNQNINRILPNSNPFTGTIFNTSFELGLHATPVKGFELFLNFLYTGVLSGRDNFSQVFGEETVTTYWNISASGIFQFIIDRDNDIFIQPKFIFNTNKTKNLLDTNEPVNFHIQFGIKQRF